MPFAATWMLLEIIILTEVSQKEKDIYHRTLLYVNLKHDTNEPIYETGNRLTDKNRLAAKRESVRGRMEWEAGVGQYQGFPGGSDGKESACNAGDLGLIPGLGRSHREGNGYPCQYSCLEHSMAIGAWQATVHGVAKSRTRLTNSHFHFHFLLSDKPQSPTVEHRELYSINYDKP